MPDASDHTFRAEPQTLRLRAIAPSLTVNDVEASLSWYRDVVGFHVHELWEHDGKVMGADLVAGSAHLMIGQDDFAKGKDRSKGIGFRLYMTTAQSIDDLAAAIESRGGTLASPPEDQPWGARAFSLVDPDGFLMTIAAERE